MRTKAIIRGIIILILAVNAWLVAKGISPLDNAVLTEALSYIAGLVAIFYAGWWKNNNVTEIAQEAQEVLDELKALTPEAAEELFDGEGEDPEEGEEDE